MFEQKYTISSRYWFGKLNTTKIYYGLSETKFKARYSNHKKFFHHEKHGNDTQLSDELWKIKASK